MFSNLGFLVKENLINDASLEMHINLHDLSDDNQYLINLYTSSHPIDQQGISEEIFDQLGYDTNPLTKFFSYDQLQYTQMQAASEEVWDISADQLS